MQLTRQPYFSLKSIIRDLLYAHDLHEFTDFFCAGSDKTTPPLCSIDARWQFPWRSALFTLGLIIFVLLFMIGEFWAREALNNVKLFLGAIVVGSIAVPLGLISLFAEMNLWRNISWLRICALAALGGFMALIIALLLFVFNINESLFNAGFVEEPAKIIAVLLIAGHRGRNGYILNGMVLGAAVGAGFAIFESLGYAYEALFSYNTELNTISINHQNALNVMAGRSIFCLTAGHITWTAITSAALWACMRKRTLWLAIIHPFFLMCLVAATLIHGSWNIIATNGSLFNFAPLFGLFTWSLIMLLYHMGIKQIRVAQLQWLTDQAHRKQFHIANSDEELAPESVSAAELMEKIASAELTEQEFCLYAEDFPHKIQLRQLFFIRALRRGSPALNWYQMPPALWFRLAQLLGLGSLISLAITPFQTVCGISGYIFCSCLLGLLLLRVALRIWTLIEPPKSSQGASGVIELPTMGAQMWIKLLIPLYQIYWGYVLWVRLIRFVNLHRTGRMCIPLWIPRLYWTTFCLAITLCMLIILAGVYTFVFYAIFLIIFYPISAFLMSLALMSSEKGK